MRRVPASMLAAWMSGGFIGDNRPICRATIQVPFNFLYTQDNSLYASLLFRTETAKVDHTGRTTSDEDHYRPMELPNIKSMTWSRSVDQDIASATITLYNWAPLSPGQQPPPQWTDTFGMPGYFTYTAANEWTRMLVPDRIVRTFEGYGCTPDVIPERDPKLMISGVWLIDSVEYTADGMITLQCRDLARALTDQIIFPPVCPLNRYPVYFDARKEKSTGLKPINPHLVWNHEALLMDLKGNRWNLIAGSSTRPVGSRIPVSYDSCSAAVWGKSLVQYGHRPEHAFDASQTSFWLSEGYSTFGYFSDYPWIQGKLPNRTVDRIVVNSPKVAIHGVDLTGSNKVQNYPVIVVYVSVFADGRWQGHERIPYDPWCHTYFPDDRPGNPNYGSWRVFKYYTVQGGDSLRSIAAKLGTTWQMLYSLNSDVIGPNPNVLFHGQKLLKPYTSQGTPWTWTNSHIPFFGMFWLWPDGNYWDIVLPQPIDRVTKIRITYWHLAQYPHTSGWRVGLTYMSAYAPGDPRHPVPLPSVLPGDPGTGQALVPGAKVVPGTHVGYDQVPTYQIQGNYADYTDIPKLFAAWGGFYWPQDAYNFLSDGTKVYFPIPGGKGDGALNYYTDAQLAKLIFFRTVYGREEVYEKNKTINQMDTSLREKATGRVWGDFETVGATGIYTLPVSQFDKKPLMDGVSTIRETVGYYFFIDETGGVIWRQPNLFKVGNYISDPMSYGSETPDRAASREPTYVNDSSTNPASTHPFTPKDGDLLVAYVAMKIYDGGDPDVLASVSSTPALPWTKRAESKPSVVGRKNYTAIFTAPAIGDRSTVVTFTGGSAPCDRKLQVACYAGVDTADPVGATGHGGQYQTQHVHFTSTAAKSLGCVCAVDDGHGLPQSASTATIVEANPTHGFFSTSYISYQASVSGSAGSSVSIDATGIKGDLSYSYIELLPTKHPRTVVTWAPNLRIRTESMYTLDENQVIVGLRAQLSSANIREREFIAATDGKTGAAVQGWNPFPIGLRRVGLWCVDTETEIFTKRGWLRYDEVKQGDETLALDPGTGLAGWQPITEVAVFDAQPREMVAFEANNFSALTTPDHRWLTERYHTQHKQWRWRWRTSETLTNLDRIPRARPVVDLPVREELDDSIVELVAWAYTDRTIKRSTLTTTVHINQDERANPGNCTRIRRALQQAFGPSWRSRRRPETRAGWWEGPWSGHPSMLSWHLTVGASRQLLQYLGEDYAPTMDFLLALSQRQLELFIEVCCLADGSTRRTSGSKTQSRFFYQTPGPRLDAFLSSCALAGIATSYHVREPDAARDDFSKQPKATVTLLSEDNYMPNARPNRGAFRVSHDGEVWCPSLPERHNWLARRRGVTYFTGNTDDNFKSTTECLRMGQLIQLRRMFAYRSDGVTVPGFPGIQIDDQIEIVEKITGSTGYQDRPHWGPLPHRRGIVHYVKSINSNLDMESGTWTYELATHWLGYSPESLWVFNPNDLLPETKAFLKATNTAPDNPNVTQPPPTTNY